MTRKFRVTIGGVTYNVEVEEVGAAGAPAAPARSAAAPAAAAHVSAPAPVSAPPAPAAAAPPAAAHPEPSAAGDVIRAPLPGMIVAVRVEVGQKVNAGEVVLVLEAMKMENDITAPTGGTVKQVLAAKGTAVSLGDALVVIGE